MTDLDQAPPIAEPACAKPERRYGEGRKEPMEAEEFNAALEALGYSQAAFARLLTELGGRKVHNTTVNDWATGKTAVHAGVAAYLNLRLRIKALGLTIEGA